MKIKFQNKRGFTLVEIMMVVIIIGILAVLAIPRYQKYLLESKLSEVQVHLGEIKQGESKYYNSHGQKYRTVLAGDAVSPETLNEALERILRIELGSKRFFQYSVHAYGNSPTNADVGYAVKAELTPEGQQEFNFTDARCVWFIYPPENRPKDSTDPNQYDEKWIKGWNDEEFFNPNIAAGSEKVTSVTDVDGTTYTLSQW